MSSGKAQHFNAYKRYLLTLELKHVLCMTPEELEQAEQEEHEEGGGTTCSGSDDDRSDDDSEGGTTTDIEGQRNFDGDDMDEESLAIAREMADDQRDLEEDLDPSELLSELLHMPDESELIPPASVVSLIAIPAPGEPWDQELALETEPADSGSSKDFELDIDPRDGLSALRPAMARNEGSRIMHGNAITHEDAG